MLTRSRIIMAKVCCEDVSAPMLTRSAIKLVFVFMMETGCLV
ncbi:hypothetical protein HanPSC8_Chr14g0603561 [Helianthus annuus]|nr:hypothetical protein HanPSC8_Chr14g0603561 [Helianthus annuus]